MAVAVTDLDKQARQILLEHNGGYAEDFPPYELVVPLEVAWSAIRAALTTAKEVHARE